jgi:hypothetical protein
MNEDADKLEDVCIDRLFWLAEMIYSIWSHINGFWELELVVNLASRHCCDVKVESLEIKDEMVGYVFQTSPARPLSNTNLKELEWIM